MKFEQCYIEYVNGRWGIYWPDNERAWPWTFKTRGWATRTLKWLNS